MCSRQAKTFIFPLALICTLSVMFSSHSSAGAAQPESLEASTAVWGGLPPGARVTGTDPKEGFRNVELTEDLPESIEGRFCNWLVWPVTNWPEANNFLRRSIHFVTTAITPDGTFSLAVKEGVKATPAHRKHEGLLAYLCFDPDKKGELKYPLPPVYQAAKDHDMLTPIQKQALSSLDEVLDGRFRRLKDLWKDFSQATYIMCSRDRLITALANFYLLSPGIPFKTLEPDDFFDRAQRVRLRGLGYQIRGRCAIRLSENKLSIVLKNCPLSQIASQWDRIGSARQQGERDKHVALVARPEDANREIDATLQADVRTLAEAEKLALGFLLAIEGMTESPRF